MSNQTQQLVLKTPVGELVYPWLNKADVKFNAEGIYHVKVKVPAAEAESLVSRLKEIRDTAAREEQAKTGRRVKLQDLPFEESLDGQFITFKAKLNAKGVNRKTGQPFEQKPVVYGPDGAPTEQLVTNGSKALVAFVPSVFANAALGVGLTLRLKAVKVVEFAAMSGGNGTNIFGDPLKPRTTASYDTDAQDNNGDNDGAYDFA